MTYWWAVFNYSYRARSSTLLRAISGPTCSFCSGVASEIDQRRAEDARFEGAQVSLVAAVTAEGDAAEGLLTNTVISQSAGRTVSADGVVVQTFPARRSVRSDMAVSWKGSSWRVLGISLGTGGTS